MGSPRQFIQKTMFVALAVVLGLTPLLPLHHSSAPAFAQDTSGALLAVVGAAGASLYDAPGGAVVTALATGDVLDADGRTADSQWLHVVTDRGAKGWVQAADVVAFGLNRLPVAGEAPAAAAAESASPTAPPTVAPTATPTQAPTATPTQAPTAPPTPTSTPLPSPTPTQAPATATAALPADQGTAAASDTTGAGAATATAIAVVGAAGADLYDAPDGKVIAALPLAEALNLSGRDASGAWLLATTNAGKTGWVEASAVVAFDTEELPVAAGGPAAAAQDAASAAEAPAADAATVTATVTVTSTISVTATIPAAAASDDGAVATAVVRADTGARLNIRSGPGVSNPVVGKAAAGEALDVTGRSSDGSWLRISRADLPGGEGWVSAAFVTMGDASTEPPTVESKVAPAAPRQEQAAPAAPAAVPAGDDTALPTPTSAPVAAPAAIQASPAGLTGNLAFMDGRNNIYLYNLATGAVRWLTNGYDPAISPDGSQVAFYRGGGDENGVWVINSDGTDARRIHGGGEFMRSPKWSPDGSRIVFSRMTGTWKCFDLEFIGCLSMKQIIERFGSMIPSMFIRKALGIKNEDRLEFPNWGITSIKADGSDFRDVAAMDSAVAPDWNEAGIVYQSTAGIEVTQDKEGAQTQAVLQEDWDHDPDWQPGGGRILFHSKEGSHWEIWSMNPDGSDLYALTRPVTTLVDEMPSNVSPAWSPDGQHIAYVSSRQPDNEHGPWRLWVMDANGANQRPLPIDIEIDFSFADEQMVSWQ